MSDPADPPDALASPDPWLHGFMLGEWRVDVSGNRLQRGDEVRPLRHKAMELLLLLARHAGRTVTRDQIIDAVWAGNRFVAPKAINTAVWTIRQTLGDDPETPQYLETIAKKGYRLVAPVSLLQPVQPWPPAASPDRATEAAVPVPSVGPVAPSPRRRLATGLVGVAVLALGVAGLQQVLTRDEAPAPPREGSSSASSAATTSTAEASGAPSFRAPPTPEALTQAPGVEYLGALSPDGRRLAFGWWRGRGVGELHLLEMQNVAQAPRPLATDRGDITGMAWSPDGDTLAYTALQPGGRCRLWLQPVPAGDEAAAPARERAACAPLSTPVLAWSPDGRRLVFSAEREGAGGLFALTPDGTVPERLTTVPPAAMADHQPAWSPDGQRLVFVRQDPSDGTRDLHEWTEGGGVQRLTSLKLQTVHGVAYAAGGRDVIYSTTHQDTRVLMLWQRAEGRVRPLGLEGSAPVRAADGSLVYSLLRTHVSLARLRWGQAPVRLAPGISSDRQPQPDPTGQQVAFISRRTGAPELWRVPAEGGAPRAVTTLKGTVESPAWSPSGDRLAFVGSCGPGGRQGLCTVPATGGTPLALVADAAAYASPAWHPRGDEVWVASDRGGTWQLWRFPAAGGDGQVVPTGMPPGGSLQWRADGQGLMYQSRGERHLQWRPATGPERRVEVVGPGEELVDWRLDGSGVVVLTRSDRDRWWRVDPGSGRRQPLGDLPLGTLPERARFAMAGPGAVWVEVANTQVADLMRVR